MKPRHKRFTLAVGVVLAVGAVVALVLNAFRSNLVFFYSPSQVAANEAPQATAPSDSAESCSRVASSATALQVNFVVTDTAQTTPVRYEGILPDLFREGKGVVAQGQFDAMACSSRARCWPSTTRTTCRPRRPRH